MSCHTHLALAASSDPTLQLFNFAIGYATPYLVDAVNTNVFYICKYILE